MASDVESARASYDGAPPWVGATWTTRMRSAVTRKLDERFVEAAGVRMRFFGMPIPGSEVPEIRLGPAQGLRLASESGT
jgi:hypothetical protein